MDNNAAILARLDVIDNRLSSIDKHLEKQNGSVEKNDNRIGAIELRMVSIETRCHLTEHYGEKEHTRLEAEQKEDQKKIWDLVKQNGTIVLSILLVLDMIGGWLGWF